MPWLWNSFPTWGGWNSLLSMRFPSWIHSQDHPWRITCLCHSRGYFAPWKNRDTLALPRQEAAMTWNPLASSDQTTIAPGQKRVTLVHHDVGWALDKTGGKIRIPWNLKPKRFLQQFCDTNNYGREIRSNYSRWLFEAFRTVLNRTNSKFITNQPLIIIWFIHYPLLQPLIQFNHSFTD